MATKKPTIKDVAKEANVGISIVSYVLNNTPGRSIPNETKQRVFDAVKRLNFVPNAAARSMRTQKVMNVGLISTWDITNDSFTAMLQGIVDTLDQRGYTLTIGNIEKHNMEQSNVLKHYSQNKIEGILFMSHPSRVEEEEIYIHAFQKLAIPFVLLSGMSKDPMINSISLNYYQTSYLAAEQLIKLGHRHIGYLYSIDMERLMPEEVAARFNGYKAAMRTHELAIAEDAILKIDMDDMAWSDQEMIRYLQETRTTCGITAIVSYKTRYAAALMNIAIDCGVNIPKELSIISANYQSMAPFLYPSLSTVQFPLYEVGSKGAEILLQTIEGNQQTPMQMMYAGVLCSRGSEGTQCNLQKS